MTNDDILCGSDAQVAMMRRAFFLHRLLGDNPRYCYQARTVSVAGDCPGLADKVIDLARLQGYASAQFVSRERGADLAATYRAAGLEVVAWDQYHGRETALKASRDFLKNYVRPDGLHLNSVTQDSDDNTLRAICAASLASGVTPPPGSAMRGSGPRGVFLYVTDTKGSIVAVGGGFMAYHRDSAYADEAFWGMLGTSPDWRGKRLACWVGAQAVIELHERHGANGFSSGVKADNPASQAMCSRLGILRSDSVYAGAIDQSLMGTAPVTR